MKRQKLKIGMIALALFGLVLSSCDDSAIIEDDLNVEAIDLKAAESEAEIDQVSDETSSIIEEAFLMQEHPDTKTHPITDRYLPDCVTITVVIVQNMKTVTIDFGEGCELRNGNFVSGKIMLVYENDPEAASRMITYAFENFYFNRKNVEGGGSILRERSNENGNPQSTKTFDITVTWPDGLFASKEGVKMREWIEGYDTHAWGDNVFLITGHWKFVKKDGTELTASIIEALRRELACKFIVSGIVELSKNENNAVLDYGDGECDDLATVSINGGEEREIHLSNF
ncbi:MAG: hypothetical protein KJO83_04100 [Bacteroidia bacterium]|nr:hypothetical protein [Bacteroidia bacterium]